jgi:SAM-dependent methyltransferase
VLVFLPDSSSESYDEGYYGDGPSKFPGLSGRLRQEFANRRARRARRLAGSRGACLDIGCGDGDFLAALQTLGWSVTGCELPGPAFQRASERLPGRIVAASTLRDLPDSSFDLVSLWQVFEHLPNPRDVLHEIHRLLKPGGRLVVAVPNPSAWQARWGGRHWLHLDPPRHLHLATPLQLRNLLHDAGFAPDRCVRPWIEFGPIGVVQTALNKLSLPRDEFFEFLRTGWRSCSRSRRMGYLAVVGILIGPAVILSAAEALFGFPATYEMWAERASSKRT